MGILQNFPAKVMCMYLFYVDQSTILFFPSESIIFPPESTRKPFDFF